MLQQNIDRNSESEYRLHIETHFLPVFTETCPASLIVVSGMLQTSCSEGKQSGKKRGDLAVFVNCLAVFVQGLWRSGPRMTLEYKGSQNLLMS